MCVRVCKVGRVAQCDFEMMFNMNVVFLHLLSQNVWDFFSCLHEWQIRGYLLTLFDTTLLEKADQEPVTLLCVNLIYIHVVWF